MKNLKSHLLIGMLLVLSFLGHPLNCTNVQEGQALIVPQNVPSKKLQQIIALKNKKTKKIRKKRSAIRRIYLKAKRMAQSPINYVFGKKPSRAKKAFYFLVGTAIFMLVAYEKYEHMWTMADIPDEKEKENSSSETGLVVVQETGKQKKEEKVINEDAFTITNVNQQTKDKNLIDQAVIGSLDQVSSSNKNDEEDQSQKTVTNDSEVVEKPKNNEQVAAENMPNNGGDGQSAGEISQNRSQNKPLPEDSHKEEESSFWDKILPDKDKYASRQDKFLANCNSVISDLKWLLGLDGTETNNTRQDQREIKVTQNEIKISKVQTKVPEVLVVQNKPKTEEKPQNSTETKRSPNIQAQPQTQPQPQIQQVLQPDQQDPVSIASVKIKPVADELKQIENVDAKKQRFYELQHKDCDSEENQEFCALREELFPERVFIKKTKINKNKKRYI